MQYDRYYSQNGKAIIFEDIANHTRYKKTNISSQLYIFWLNFDKENHIFLHPFLLLGEKFSKNCCMRNYRFLFT